MTYTYWNHTVPTRRASDLFTTRTADAGLAGGNDAVEFDRTGLQQRQQPKLYRGGITTRIGDHARLANRVAMHSGQTIHGFVEQAGSAVLKLVPLLERSEEHTSELQSLMRNSYAVFCLKKKKSPTITYATTTLLLIS